MGDDRHSRAVITVEQVDPRHGEKGLIYWGLKLEKLSEELGAETKPRNLYGSRVDGEISKLARNYLLLLFSSLAIILTVFGLQLDKLLTYGFIGVIPLSYFYGTRYHVYRKIKNRTRNP